MSATVSPRIESVRDRFRDGDPDVVREILVTVRTIVAARGYYIPTGDRADVVQEVLIGLWNSSANETFDSPESWSAFVREVAHRRCVDWLRRHVVVKRHLTPMTPLDENRPAPTRRADAVLLGNERVELAGRALRSLGAGCRDLICRHVRDRMSYAEIARATGRSEGALRVQMTECLRNARKIIDRLASGGPTP